MKMIEHPVCVAPITFEEEMYMGRYHGHEYFFCSWSCKQQFDQEREAYFARRRKPPLYQ